MVVAPHFAIPFRVGSDGSVVVNEQDTIEDIAQAVSVVLTTVVGSRDELPQYGIPDQTFVTQIDRQTIIALVRQWEPRVALLIQSEPDMFDEMVANVLVTVQENNP